MPSVLQVAVVSPATHREVEQRLRRAAVDLGRIAEHLDELATPENSALMGLLGALWYQEARLGLLTSVAKLTATAEMVHQGSQPPDTGPGLYVPDHAR